MVITRAGSERVHDFAFRLAQRRKRRGRPGRLTCVDKANVFRSMAFFRKIFDERAQRFPDVTADHHYIDAERARSRTQSPGIDDNGPDTCCRYRRRLLQPLPPGRVAAHRRRRARRLVRHGPGQDRTDHGLDRVSAFPQHVKRRLGSKGMRSNRHASPATNRIIQRGSPVGDGPAGGPTRPSETTAPRTERFGSRPSMIISAGGSASTRQPPAG